MSPKGNNTSSGSTPVQLAVGKRFSEGLQAWNAGRTSWIPQICKNRIRTSWCVRPSNYFRGFRCILKKGPLLREKQKNTGVIYGSQFKCVQKATDPTSAFHAWWTCSTAKPPCRAMTFHAVRYAAIPWCPARALFAPYCVLPYFVRLVTFYPQATRHLLRWLKKERGGGRPESKWESKVETAKETTNQNWCSELCNQPMVDNICDQQKLFKNSEMRTH